jgi:predicted RNA methylase
MHQMAGGRQMKSVWTIPPPEPWEKKFGKHPTQKPLALLERILLASSSEGDLVLDPFLGSGTTAVAALRLSRSVLGIEAGGIWLELSLNRLCSELVSVRVTLNFSEISLDLFTDPVDRSTWMKSPPMETAPTTRLVRRERNFYFVGAARREVVFSASATDLDDAWSKFGSSFERDTQVIFVIKTETEIYLAQ